MASKTIVLPNQSKIHQGPDDLLNRLTSSSTGGEEKRHKSSIKMAKTMMLQQVGVEDLQENAVRHEAASEEQVCLAALSKLLRVTMLDAQAWDRAVEQGYIEVRAEGGLRWTLESQTLLAYFCGRLWSGDRGAYSRRKKAMVWIMGDQGTFPAAALGRLFGNTSLKQTRNRRRNMTLPEQFQIIDFLFNS